MLRRTFAFAVATFLGFSGADLMAQVAAPSGKTADIAPQAAAAAPAVGTPISWRYRQWNGNWWYWTTRNEWVVWHNGQWAKPGSVSPRIADQGSTSGQTEAVRQYRTYRFSPGAYGSQTFQQGTGGYHTEPGYSNLHRQPGFPTMQQGTGGYHDEPGYSNLHRQPGTPTIQQGTGGYHNEPGYSNQPN